MTFIFACDPFYDSSLIPYRWNQNITQNITQYSAETQITGACVSNGPTDMGDTAAHLSFKHWQVLFFFACAMADVRHTLYQTCPNCLPNCRTQTSAKGCFQHNGITYCFVQSRWHFHFHLCDSGGHLLIRALGALEPRLMSEERREKQRSIFNANKSQVYGCQLCHQFIHSELHGIYS